MRRSRKVKFVGWRCLVCAFIIRTVSPAWCSTIKCPMCGNIDDDQFEVVTE
jgi:rubrerythrin